MKSVLPSLSSLSSKHIDVISEYYQKIKSGKGQLNLVVIGG